MRLEIMVVRSAGEALTDSRTEVFFELAVLDGDADQQAAMPPETMRTVAKKRSHILDFRAKSDMIEFGDVFDVELKNLSGRLSIICVKGGKPVGHTVIPLDTLPRAQSAPPVSRWFSLQDSHRRNVSAQVYLKLRLHHHLAVTPLVLNRQPSRSNAGKPGSSISPMNLNSPNMSVFPVQHNHLQKSRSKVLLGTPESYGTQFVDYIALIAIGQDVSPVVIDRYPKLDRSWVDFPDTAMMGDMCYPRGIGLEMERCCFNFFLSKTSTYGTAFVFQAQPQIVKVTAVGEPDSPPQEFLYSEFALVILSSTGLCSVFQSIIADIFEQMGPRGAPFDAPTLRYVAFLCDDVPRPEPGGPSLLLASPRDPAISWRISTPGPVEQFQFPLLDFSVLFLLRILDISAVLLAIASILTGKSVVVHSSQLSLLMPVCECLIALIFPFRWTNVYIPLLPRGILQVLESPVPFIIGTLTENLEHIQLAPHCVLLDIDMSIVTCESSLVLLPAQPTKLLQREVRKQVFHDLIFSADRKSPLDQRLGTIPLESQPTIFLSSASNMARETKVRQFFLRYIGSLLHDYRKYLRFDTNNDAHFDSATFLEQRMDARPFLSRFIQTQMFTEFLELHVETPSLLDDFLFYNSVDQCGVSQDSPVEEIRIDGPRLHRNQHPVVQKALYFKNERESACPAMQSRLYLFLNDLLSHDGSPTCSVGELYSVAELLTFPQWRSLFITTVTEAVDTAAKTSGLPKSQPSLQLPWDRYCSLAFLFGRALDQAGHTPRDYGFARTCISDDIALQIAGKLLSGPTGSGQKAKPTLIVLKDSLKHCAVWRQQSFWEYYLSLAILEHFKCQWDEEQSVLLAGQNAVCEPPVKSRSNSMPDVLTTFASLQNRNRSVEEETFVFREIGSIISTLHALELPRDLVSQVTSNLGRLWHMEESWIDDLNTVVNNIFRTQPEESPFRRAAPAKGSQLPANFPSPSTLTGMFSPSIIGSVVDRRPIRSPAVRSPQRTATFTSFKEGPDIDGSSPSRRRHHSF
ncbi:UDENN domain-containing protein [Plasmodiophora brassicae]